MKYTCILIFFLYTCILTCQAGIEELVLAQEVAAGEVEEVTYVPANGKVVMLHEFIGNAAEDPNTTVLVVWDFGEAGETVIWSTHGSIREFPNISVGTGDGTKKVGLCLKNDDSVARILSGKIVLETQ